MTWAETVGLSLIKRDLNTMTLRSPHGQIMGYEILQIFPFTSESKRMGIIVRVCCTNVVPGFQSYALL